MKTFIAKGHVLGKTWGGGASVYPASQRKANTKKQLMKELEEALENGSLDGGMGFEYLIGAIIDIEEIETITENKKEYSHSSFSTHFIGKLKSQQKEFLSRL